MTPDERAAVGEVLAAELDQLAAGEAGLVAELAAVVDASDRANLDDEHDPEGATVGYERARAAGLLDAVRGRSAQVTSARERLRAGTYGRCADCGQPIAPERLSAYPAAVACVPCVAIETRPPLRRA